MPETVTLARKVRAAATAATGEAVDDDLAAELAAAAYTLAWSAQTPSTRTHHGDHRGDHGADRRAPARSDLAEVARVVRAASRARGGDRRAGPDPARRGPLIQAWHDHQQQHRQAATLGAGYRRCQLAARDPVATRRARPVNHGRSRSHRWR